MSKQPKREEHYVWMEWDEFEGRLLVPWGDPQEHEQPFDFLFGSVDDAKRAKVEWQAEDEDWILCRRIVEPI